MVTFRLVFNSRTRIIALGASYVMFLRLLHRYVLALMPCGVCCQISEELPDVPLYYDAGRLASTCRLSVPPILDLRWETVHVRTRRLVRYITPGADTICIWETLISSVVPSISQMYSTV